MLECQKQQRTVLSKVVILRIGWAVGGWFSETPTFVKNCPTHLNVPTTQENSIAMYSIDSPPPCAVG